MTAVRSSLDDGKNNSRATDSAETEQSTLSDHTDVRDRDDDPERYDCREIYRNMELESESGETAGFRCNSWDCYCCAHRMRMNLIEELEKLVDERPEMRRLLTLTIGEDGPDLAEEGHEYITKRFNALMTGLKDVYGDISYVWIRHEGDLRGRPHLHLLVDRYLPQEVLSERSQQVGLGEIVDIRRVNARNAAKYLTSYLGKGTLASLPSGLRRYGSSEDIDLEVRGPSDEPDEEWRLMMDDYEVQPRYGEGPLRREVTATDLYRQRVEGGPPGLDPPDTS